MEKKIVKITNAKNETFYIEADVDTAAVQSKSDGKKFISAEKKFISAEKSIVEATNTFEEALHPIVNFADNVINEITNLKIQKPSAIELQFAIKLSGAVNLWVVSGNGEGSVSLKLTWSAPK